MRKPVAFIAFDHVTFGYDVNVPVIQNLSLEIPRDKVTAILGRSGCGKTTLLSLIGGLVAADSGRVIFDGTVVDRRDTPSLYRLRRRLGMLFQFGALFTDLDVFENVAYPLREHTQLPESMVRDIVLMKLNAVGLRGAVDMRIAELSGGMARRVALARAIALDPQLILYDEPFTGLDPISAAVTAKLIRELNDITHATSIIVSHDVSRCVAIADHVVLMGTLGRIVMQGTPAELMASADPETRQFVHGDKDGPLKLDYPAPAIALDFGIAA